MRLRICRLAGIAASFAVVGGLLAAAWLFVDSQIRG